MGKRVFTDESLNALVNEIKTGDNELQSQITTNTTKLNYTNIAYGICETAAETAAKVVTIQGNTNWKLDTGSLVYIKFTNSNASTAVNVTINVNNTGAYPIWYNATEYTSYSTTYCGYAGRTTAYIFNGTHWVWISNSYDANTQSNTNSTDTSSKIFLVGATKQGSSQTTYSHGEVYVGTDHHVYSNSKQVVNLSDTQALTNKTYNGYTLGAACAKGVDTSATSGSANLITSGAMYTALAGKASTSVATTSANGLMSSTDKSKLDGLSNYTLPVAGTALGGVKSGTDITIDSSGNVSVNDNSHNHNASNITAGTLAVARGGTGVTANPSMLTNLGSTTAASVFAASPRPGVTGTLLIANGGTGATDKKTAKTNLGITISTSAPSGGSDGDIWIQYS